MRKDIVLSWRSLSVASIRWSETAATATISVLTSTGFQADDVRREIDISRFNGLRVVAAGVDRDSFGDCNGLTPAEASGPRLQRSGVPIRALRAARAEPLQGETRDFPRIF
jgi:hypothetical protein